MANSGTYQDWVDRIVYDAQGEKIGSLEGVFVEENSNEPRFAALNTGLFGMRHSLVPVDSIEEQGDDLVTSHSKEKVNGAPNTDTDGYLSDEEDEELALYYGLSHQGHAHGQGQAQPATHDGDDEETLTLAEEKLHVGVERQATGRARIRKVVKEKMVNIPVKLRTEELKIERTAIDGDQRGQVSANAFQNEEHTVTLHEERPVVGKEAVATEQVRLSRDIHTREETVSDTVRKEDVEIDEDDTLTRTN